MSNKVHKVRFYAPKPQPINCISFNKTAKHVAIARGDASIEIWDLNYAPFLLKVIPGTNQGSVEALGWVGYRLLSTGLGGALVEWDLDKLGIKNTAVLTGYAAWCLDISVDQTLAAVGTEQGYLNLYTVSNDDIVYKKIFDKQEGRILCCKFNNTGNILITGSVNTIRVWNVDTGHAITRMSVSRRDKQVIVWCLAVLSDNTVISGDSLGRLTFWDSNLGDQIESYTTHKADILSIAVSDDETKLFCSGVDPVILNFIKMDQDNDSERNDQWIKHVQRNIHEHDVRGLVINGEQLISVGIDGYLTFSSYPPKWVMRVPPILNECSMISPSKRLLLLRYGTHLDIWKLGSYETSDSGQVVSNVEKKERDNNKRSQLEKDTVAKIITMARALGRQVSLKVTVKPIKLASIQGKQRKQICCCALSPNGELIVYCTSSHIRILKLEIDDEQLNVSVSKVMVTGAAMPCDRLAFTEDSRLLVAHSVGVLQVLQVDPEAGATVIQTIQLEKYFKTKSILHLTISAPTKDGCTYMVVADIKGGIEVWKLNSKKFEHYVTLPRYHCVPSALAVDVIQHTLIICYVDQKLTEYDLANKKYTAWPSEALPMEWHSRRSAVMSISPHSVRDVIFFRDLTSLWVLSRQTERVHEKGPKRKVLPPKLRLKVTPIRYLAGFHQVSDEEAVSVEVPPQNIVAQLPAVTVGRMHSRPYA